MHGHVWQLHSYPWWGRPSRLFLEDIKQIIAIIDQPIEYQHLLHISLFTIDVNCMKGFLFLQINMTVHELVILIFLSNKLILLSVLNTSTWVIPELMAVLKHIYTVTVTNSSSSPLKCTYIKESLYTDGQDLPHPIPRDNEMCDLKYMLCLLCHWYTDRFMNIQTSYLYILKVGYKYYVWDWFVYVFVLILLLFNWIFIR